jgi:hypothetical protein
MLAYVVIGVGVMVMAGSYLLVWIIDTRSYVLFPENCGNSRGSQAKDY